MLRLSCDCFWCSLAAAAGFELREELERVAASDCPYALLGLRQRMIHAAREKFGVNLQLDGDLCTSQEIAVSAAIADAGAMSTTIAQRFGSPIASPRMPASSTSGLSLLRTSSSSFTKENSPPRKNVSQLRRAAVALPSRPWTNCRRCGEAPRAAFSRGDWWLICDRCERATIAPRSFHDYLEDVTGANDQKANNDGGQR